LDDRKDYGRIVAEMEHTNESGIAWAIYYVPRKTQNFVEPKHPLMSFSFSYHVRDETSQAHKLTV
jgi:hypothetical protein